MKKDLLFELGTEELPTKAVKKLSNSLKDLVIAELAAKKLSFEKIKVFATPRRLGFIISSLQTKQSDYITERRGPAVKAAYDKNNALTKAALGFINSCNAEPKDIETIETDKGSWLIYKQPVTGINTEDLLQEILSNCIKKLSIAKPMRWGEHEYSFVRPVHWLLLLFGDKIININLLGLKSGNKTYGHRFLSPEALTISEPSEYEPILTKNHVISDFNTRRETIIKQVTKLAKDNNLIAYTPDDLLDEVTSLVEWPVALWGSYDRKFLAVPQECLITSMVSNQKYFAITDSNNKLQPYFIFISNIESKKPAQVISGNERVLSARLADAEFFFLKDKKTKLRDTIENLKTITYQQKLGSLYQKTKRIEQLSELIVNNLQTNNSSNLSKIPYCFETIDINNLKKAALLSKTDLQTEMVFEFPELQGIMGKYYALNNGEPSLVANAIEQHYLPKQAGDILPDSIEACILAIADKMDTIVGIFGIGQKPTGDKDPFGLRRAALGILRILIEKELPIDLADIIEFSIFCYKNNSNLSEKEKASLNSCHQECIDFCFDRLKKYYQDQGISISLFYSVNNTHTTSPYDFNQRIHAVSNFLTLPQAENLIAANKRVKNILNKQKTQKLPNKINITYLQEDAEKNLNNLLLDKNTKLEPLFNNNDYNKILQSLANLQSPIDDFFDKVMVMSDDVNLQNNRLLLLRNIQLLFNKVADISELQQ